MAKVRYNQRCAGGCGEMLLSGTFGVRIHNSWWCAACAIAHKRTCLQFAGH